MLADSLTMHSSFGTRFDPDLLDEEYRRWQEDPESVDSGWAAFFEGFELGDLEERDGAAVAQLDAEAGDVSLQTRVDGLVYAYRTLGHTIARLDPLADERPQNPLLSLRELGFSDKDLGMQVSSKFFLDGKKMTLREMIAKLESMYADTIGTEFMHIQNTRIRNWVRHRLESRDRNARRRSPFKCIFCARFSKRNRSNRFCTHVMSDRSAFRLRALSRSW